MKINNFSQYISKTLLHQLLENFIKLLLFDIKTIIFAEKIFAAAVIIIIF